MIEEKSINSIIASMKLNHLKELSKVFEIHVSGGKKNNFIEDISAYIKSNISVILENFITYDEYKFIKKLYKENYIIILNENDKSYEKIRNSLEYLGLVYTYLDFKQRKVSVPIEIRSSINFGIFDTNIIKRYKENQKLVELFKNLLDIYGIIPINILIDYISEYIVSENSIHEAIKFLWRYNFRYNLYYNDTKLNYFSIKIIDIRYLNKKLIDNQSLKYKYYNKSQLKTMSNSKLIYVENQIYIILKRYLKSSEITLEYVDYIRTMIKNDFSSKKISEIIMQKTKRMSEQGRIITEKLIDRLREFYPLWSLKGHSLKDLEYEDLKIKHSI